MPTQEDHTWRYGAETNFSSGYVWRGILLNQGPVMQPSIWISRYGLTLSAWRNLALARTEDGEHLNVTSLTLEYGRDWKRLTIEPAIETYLTRRYEATDDSDEPTTMEGSVKLSYPVGPLRLFTVHAFDILVYRGWYFGGAGVSYKGYVTKRAKLAVSIYSGWASSKFNDVNIGINRRAFNLIGAEGAITYHLRPYLYFRPHLELNNIVNRRLRGELSAPTVLSGGFALGVEF